MKRGPNTPGYDTRLSIRIVNVDFCNARASYLSGGYWIPMRLVDAERFLARGHADRAPATCSPRKD